MSAWILLVWPLQWMQAYAQQLPATTSEQLINQRSQRLGNGWTDAGVPIRSHRQINDSTPVRTPNLNPGAADATLANRASERYQPLAVGDIVQGAQRSSDFAQGLYTTADPSNYRMEGGASDPGQSQTSSDRVNFSEIMPGYSHSAAAELITTGQSIYDDPSRAQTLSEQNDRNLKKLGCRNTSLKLLTRQDIYNAPHSAENRILKIEFFDVSNGDILTPSFFRRGTIDISRPTIGSNSNEWWDRVDETFAIRYTYTPYTNPKNKNFFTYNHKIGYFQNGNYIVVPDSVFASYGHPSDGFTPVVRQTIPHGVGTVYLSADLYRTEVNYYDPSAGQSCPPDPPSSCEVVSTNGGDTIRWCAGSPGAGVLEMYDDTTYESAEQTGKNFSDMMLANASSRDYSDDGALQGGMIRGLNAGSSSLAQELAGNCSRSTISEIQSGYNLSYSNDDIYVCSEAMVNPFPNGCEMNRAFGMSHLGNHVYLTVRAFNKIAVPVTDPVTGEAMTDLNGNAIYTYRHEPANVNGPVNVDFSIMGGSVCSSGTGSECSTEIPNRPDGSSSGYYIKYYHTPLTVNARAHAVANIAIQGGSGFFSHYGFPSGNWKPVGSAGGNNTSHELKLIANIYAVTINEFAGCQYQKYVADGLCSGGRLTCLDSSPTRNVGGLTFGPGLATEGVVELLAKWGTSSSAEFEDFDEEEGDGGDPTPTGPSITLLDNPMCWKARGEPFQQCDGMPSDSRLTEFIRNDQKWVTDCYITTDPDGYPLPASPNCSYDEEYSECDSRFQGLYTGACYNATVAYNCGERIESTVPVTYTEKGDSCSGIMRCLGTECHRPNLTGNQSADFGKVAQGMEVLNMMKMDMQCAETGEQPTTTTEVCTPLVFGGDAMYCKIPIGSNIGLTPNCCKETKDAVASMGPNWLDYLKASYLLYKISENKIVMDLLSTNGIYNSTAQTFGEIARPVTDAYQSASNFVTENLIEPLQAGFDNIFGNFGIGGGGGSSAAADVAVDAASKQGILGNVMYKFQQMLLENTYKFLYEVGGDELASQVIQKTVVNGVPKFALDGMIGNLIAGLQLAFMIYSLARLIGHIIFACKEEEYEWAMNMKWRLCTYAGNCCKKKQRFIGCIEKRKLYCCYKSIAARVIGTQLIQKNLTGTRPHGFRTGANGVYLKKCRINCSGFTPYELVNVDWGQVDLSEWLDALIQSGLFNVTDIASNYGVTDYGVQVSQAVGRADDTAGEFNQKAPATKTASGISQNIGSLQNNTETLRQATEHCYADSRQMPFTYPECSGN